MSTSTKRLWSFLAFFMSGLMAAFAQGTQGITQADQEIRAYVEPIGGLILGIGAVVGLIGAVRVYIAWNNGDNDINKKIMGWFGSCLFLVLIGVVVNAFFGT